MLAAFKFDSVSDADALAVLLRSLDAGHGHFNTDGAVVRWAQGGRRPSTKALGETPGVDRVDPIFWGLLLGRALFEPLLRANTSPTSPMPANPLALVGVDNGFLEDLRCAVAPGTSVLMLLTSGQVVDRVNRIADASADRYTDLLYVHLAREEEDALTHVFGSPPPTLRSPGVTQISTARRAAG